MLAYNRSMVAWGGSENIDGKDRKEPFFFSFLLRERLDHLVTRSDVTVFHVWCFTVYTEVNDTDLLLQLYYET